MSSISIAARSGRFRFRFAWLLLLAAAMAALHLVRTRADTKADEAARSRRRGLDYEDHVLEPQRLPYSSRRRGGHIQAHPVIYVPRVEVPARYYGAPGGYDGELIPHESQRARPWRSVRIEGSARIPDAIETRPDGQTLYELKCPSPWLTFSAGTPWAKRMQSGFASQAIAFLTWANQAPNREVTYGFCGWVPPWAQAILEDLSAHLHRPVTIEPVFFGLDFQPAERLMGRTAREVLTAAALGPLAELAPEEVMGAAYDQLKD